jgi:uncharacterized membrane protein YhaH (DUF805 family)
LVGILPAASPNLEQPSDQCQGAALLYQCMRGGLRMHLLFSFNGRIRRAVYLGGVVLNLVIVLVALAIIIFALGGPPQIGPQGEPQMSSLQLIFMAPVYLFSTWTGFALSAKRFHDMGVTGWLSLLLLIPLVNFIVALVLLFKRGEPTDNQYGPVPA